MLRLLDFTGGCRIRAASARSLRPPRAYGQTTTQEAPLARTDWGGFPAHGLSV
jgi:hypothetical protein